MPHRIAAAIVVYQPEREPLLELLRAVAADVERVSLFLNSAVEPGFLEQCAAAAAPTPVQPLGTGANVGLGRAYNEAARAAQADGCDLLLLFDQDSQPPPGMARRLAVAFDAAGGHAARVAVVGPRPVTAGVAGGYKLPPAAPSPAGLPPGLRELAFVISSGSLIDLAAIAEIGPFREDFFIDGIDIEWCFRARARGFRNLMAVAEEMPHRLGNGIIHIRLLNLDFVDNTPMRLFTYVRNQAAMMRLAHVPLWWKARAATAIAMRLFVSARGHHGQEILAIWRGFRAGLRLELGPPAPPADGRSV